MARGRRSNINHSQDQEEEEACAMAKVQSIYSAHS